MFFPKALSRASGDEITPLPLQFSDCRTSVIEAGNSSSSSLLPFAPSFMIRSPVIREDKCSVGTEVERLRWPIRKRGFGIPVHPRNRVRITRSEICDCACEEDHLRQRRSNPARAIKRSGDYSTPVQRGAVCDLMHHFIR